MRIRLSDLAPGVNYALQLRSNSGTGVSDWSRVFNLLTSSDTVAPNIPANVAGTMSGTTFNLTWDAVTLSQDGSAAHDLDYYEVKVESAGTGTVGIFLVNDTKFQLTLEQNRSLFGSPRANIKMSVQARDKTKNASGYSTPVVDQTNPAPANVTGFTGAGVPDGLTFKWNAVADTDLMEYRLYSGTSAGTQTTLEWKGLATATTLQSIAYTTDKWYKVAAADVFGTESVTPPVVGPIKPTSPFLVDTNPPPVPTGLAATLANSTDESYAIATVSWNAVADSDNDLAEYIIGYRPVGATDWQYVKVDYTNTSTKINGLLPYTNYEFRIRSSDWAANLSAWSGTATGTAASNTAPSTPAAPTAVSSLLRVQVTHNNTKAAGGAMEGDVVFYEVYGSTTTGFTPAAANQLGVMPVGPAIIGTFMLPATGGAATQTWYIKVIAVDRGGLKSVASAQVTATPGLVDAANIIDATITNAKIADLAANKITAGTGFINDITVKSKFTLGDASTVGAIESFGYIAGTDGFRLDKNLLEINEGQIKAAALLLQQGQNLVPPQFADFEFVPSFYTIGTNGLTAIYSATPPTTVALSTASPRFGKQYLTCSWAGALAFDPYLYFSNTVTDYNIPVEGGQTYIYSFYARATGAVATQLYLSTKWSNAAVSTSTSFTLPASSSTWVRYSGIVTAPAGVTGALQFAQSFTRTAGAGFEIDGIQFEQKMAGINTPSPWTPPSFTRVDGGVIRTGEIRSNTNTTVNGVSQPNWSINMSGNAQFGDAMVRGKILVGQSGADADAGQSFISSGNYVAATTGWKVDSAGNAEFNAGTFRGVLKVGITDTSGNIYGTRNYVQSRGSTDLVTNGTGLLGDDTNFSPFTFSAVDTPEGTSGAFDSPAGTLSLLDELMPVDPSRKYLWRFQAKQKAAGVTAYLYSGLSPYDTYGNIIGPQHYMFQNNTTTTLAVDLVPGATTITLTSAANWNNAAGSSTHFRNIIFWNYIDKGGKNWGDRTYSRDVRSDAYADGGISGNVITLRVPWAGFPDASNPNARTTIPAGTPVSNGSSGGTYMYIGAVNVNVPNAWTSYQGEVGGIMPSGSSLTSQTSATTAFPPGTAAAKVVFLHNRQASGVFQTGSLHSVAAVSLSDATQAQSLTEGWRTTGTTTINGGLITTNTIDARSAVIQGSVTATKFSAGAIPLMVPDPSFEDAGEFYASDAATGLDRWTLNLAVGSTVNRLKGVIPARSGDSVVMFYNGAQTQSSSLISGAIPVEPGKRYRVSGNALTPGGELTAGLFFRLYTGPTAMTSLTTLNYIGLEGVNPPYPEAGTIDFDDYPLGTILEDMDEGDNWFTGGFGYSDGSLACVNTQAKHGTQSMEVTWTGSATNGGAAGRRMWGLTVGQVYKVWVWAYVPTGSPHVKLQDIYFSQGTSTTAFNTWQPLSLTFTATGPDHYIGVTTTTLPGAGQKAYLDSWVGTDRIVAEDYTEYISDEIAIPAGHNYARVVVYGVNGITTPGWHVVDDVALTPSGQYSSELSAAGLRLFGQDGTETGAFVSNRANYFSVQANGRTLASISKKGVGTFSSILAGEATGPKFTAEGDMESGVSIYGTEFTQWLQTLPEGHIAFGYRTTAGTSSATEAPFQQLDATLKAGHLYKITAYGHGAQTTSGARVLVRLRYTTNNTTPGITSAQAQSWRSPGMYTANGSLPFSIVHFYAAPGALGDPDIESSWLTTAEPEGGGAAWITAGATFGQFMCVEDLGVYKGDTGIDRTGGSPPPVKKNYVTTYTSSSTESYRGDGTKRTDTTDVVQGYNSYNGYGKGLWIMPTTMSTNTSGSTVTKVEVYAYANHWYYNGGGTARIHVHNYTSLPSTLTTSTSFVYLSQSTSWPVGGRWVTLPNSTFTIGGVSATLHAHMAAGRIKGFGMGMTTSSSLTYYGRFNGTGAQMRVSYTK